jgi:fermentation-respiration switch protein FrsA (DUF1100 family)
MNWKRVLHRLVISAVTIIVVVAIGLSALLYFAQDHLIFFRQPAPDAPPHSADLAISEVRIATADGLSLRGWLARPAAAATKRLPLAIYFGGNAEEVSYMAASAGRLPGWSLLAVNYRGYGGNTGNPSERALFADALALYDWAAHRPEIDPRRIAAIGRSLGSGVAVYLVAERPLVAVALITPFDSLRAVAQRHYPYLPVSFLLKHPFDSIERAPRISTPLLVLAAQRDSIVPPQHARALFAQWRGPKTWREFAGAGHNDLDADPEYWKAIAAFFADRTLR